MNKLTTILVTGALAFSLTLPALANNSNSNQEKEQHKQSIEIQKQSIKNLRDKMLQDAKDWREYLKFKSAAKSDINKKYIAAVKAADQTFVSSTASARATRDAAIKAAQDAYKASTAGAKATRDAAIAAAKAARDAALNSIPTSTPPVVTTTPPVVTTTPSVTTTP